MKHPTFRGLGLIALALLSLSAHAETLRFSWGTIGQFYVSTSGKPGNDGLTPGTAVDSLQGIEAVIRKAAPTSAVVTVAPGRYFGTLTLNSVDTVPTAYNGQGAILDGGIQIKGWTTLDPRLTSRVQPSVASKLVCTDLKALGVTDFGTFPKATGSGNQPSTAIELFVNGQRQTCARWPDAGYATVATGVDKSSFTADLSSSHLLTGDTDLWLCGDPSGFAWWYSSDQVAVDRTAGTLTFCGADGVPHPQMYPSVPGAPFYIKNSLRELDQPGEYYVDKATGLLVWYPTQDPSTVTAYVSTCSGPIVKIIDQADVTFTGFTFEHGRNDCAVVQRCARCGFIGCTFQLSGGSGVVIQELGGTPGCSHDNTLQTDTFQDLGEWGAIINAGNFTTLASAGNSVQDGTFTRLGQIMPRGGVQIVGVGNSVLRGDFSNIPGMGVQMDGNNHVVGENHFAKTCMLMDDVGVIYRAAGKNLTRRGSIIRGNRIETSRGLAKGQTVWGIYEDSNASGDTIQDNRIEDTDGGILLNGGRDNSVLHNVVIGTRLAAFQVDDASLTPMPALQSMLTTANWQSPPYSMYTGLTSLPGQYPTWPDGNLFSLNTAALCGKGIVVKSINGVTFGPVGKHAVVQWSPDNVISP